MVKIFEHFWLKLMALCLGLLLWFHVATEKIYNHELTMPIEEIVLDQDLTLAGNPPDSILVLVSASGKQLLRQRWRDQGLRIVANHLKVGRHILHLATSNTYLATASKDIALDDIISPLSINLTIDVMSEERVVVIPDVITEPDDGFAVSDMSRVTPDTVTMLGPRTVVSKFKSIFTERKELKGLRNNLEVQLGLAPPAGYGIHLLPDTVTMIIEVIPVKTRIFDQVPIVVFNAPSEKKLTLVPESIRIELTGSPSDIDLLNRNALIASADFRQRDATGRAAIRIDCPAKYKVKNASADSVMVFAQ